MDNNKLKANAKFIFSSFISFLVTRYASKTYGVKVHAEYGQAAISTAMTAGAIAATKKVSDAQIALGMIAGTGMNAVWDYLSLPMIKSKLPDMIQSTLGNDNDAMYLNGNSLDGYSDEELMGNERIIDMARSMAEIDKDAYVQALMSAANRNQKLLPNETVLTVGSGVLQKTFSTGLEGEDEDDNLDGNSLD